MKNPYWLLFLFCTLFASCHDGSTGGDQTENVQQSDSSFEIEFNVKAAKLKEGGYELLDNKLRAEFNLKGTFLSKYSIEIKNDSISVLYKLENNKWEYFDTIRHMFQINDTNQILLPAYRIVDFDHDGNQDLVCWVYTNVNGNGWSVIYLNNPTRKKLCLLWNSAENDTRIWDAPQYNVKDSTISCTLLSGAFGLSFESKYKLKDYRAIPIEKQEADYSQLKMDGTGAIERSYTGKGSKWMLIKETKK